MSISKRIAAAAAAAGMVAAATLTLGATFSSANAATVVPVTADKSSNLKTGDVVTVSWKSGFPPGTVIVLECAQGVLTGDQTACDNSTIAMTSADASGAGSGAVTIKAGADFTGNGKCDAQHDCLLVATTADSSYVGLANVSFGTATKTNAGPASVKGSTTKAVKIKVTVTATDGPRTGTVAVKDGKKSLGSLTLSATGTATFSKKLAAGTHKLTFSYAGDANYVGSSDKVTVTVKKPAKKH